jgi:hypothetical protein
LQPTVIPPVTHFPSGAGTKWVHEAALPMDLFSVHYNMIAFNIVRRFAALINSVVVLIPAEHIGRVV